MVLHSRPGPQGGDAAVGHRHQGRIGKVGLRGESMVPVADGSSGVGGSPSGPRQALGRRARVQNSDVHVRTRAGGDGVTAGRPRGRSASASGSRWCQQRGGADNSERGQRSRPGPGGTGSAVYEQVGAENCHRGGAPRS